MYCSVLCLLVFLFIFLPHSYQDPGICNKTITEKRSKLTPYWDTVKRGKQTIKVKKTKKENYLVNKTVVECCKGYKTINTKCMPICSKECVNGTCSAPDTCACNAGYIKSQANNYTCNPICQISCTNGKCTAPNICSCNPGYVQDLRDKYLCIPSCKTPCQNGICSAPNMCLCNSGYQQSANNTNHCVPICNQTCQNAFCSDPEKCTCNPGFKPVNNYVCQPVCSKNCLNGQCTAPESCSCNMGYVLSKNDSYRCSPVCSLACSNSVCSAPETCSCFDGFKKNVHNWYECNPICTKSYQNGACVGPEEWQCSKWYKLEAEQCLPICQNCTNGNCTAPNVCECWHGFQVVNGTCVTTNAPNALSFAMIYGKLFFWVGLSVIITLFIILLAIIIVLCIEKHQEMIVENEDYGICEGYPFMIINGPPPRYEPKSDRKEIAEYSFT